MTHRHRLAASRAGSDSLGSRRTIASSDNKDSSFFHRGSAFRKFSHSELEVKLLNPGIDEANSCTIPVGLNFALILAITSSVPFWVT